MAELVQVSGPDLFHIRAGDIDTLANSSNSTTTQSAAGIAGGSAYLTCGIEIDDPGDSDQAYGGVESTWAVFTRSPGAGPLRLGIQFGALSLRASGSRNNESWVWSSHEVAAGLHAFARVLHPELRDLIPDELNSENLITFWNIDLGPQNEAKMRVRTVDGVDVLNLNQDRWDETLVTFSPALNYTYQPSEAIAEGDFVVFFVGFKLMIFAPLVDDYDFELNTESMASIAWVDLESLAQDAAG